MVWFRCKSSNKFRPSPEEVGRALQDSKLSIHWTGAISLGFYVPLRWLWGLGSCLRLVVWNGATSRCAMWLSYFLGIAAHRCFLLRSTLESPTPVFSALSESANACSALRETPSEQLFVWDLSDLTKASFLSWWGLSLFDHSGFG